jgi:hypothetical protein
VPVTVTVISVMIFLLVIAVAAPPFGYLGCNEM